MFSKEMKKSLMAKFAKIDINDIQDAELRQKAKSLRSKQRGFTLLELLVVVAILAAIAGTATIALQDTDARASAAAHVAMMDELNKGIRTFRVLRKNTLPSGFDSLISTTDASGTGFANAALIGATGGGAGQANDDGLWGVEDGIGILTDVPAPILEQMNAGGITSLQYLGLNASNNPDDYGNCGDINDLIAARTNAVVPGNIFLSPNANGCGFTWENIDSNASTDDFDRNGNPAIAIWTGGYERVMGADGRKYDAVDTTVSGGNITGVDGAPVLMAVGLGPASNLFNANDLGGMTTVPVYRHVTATQYNRFIALFTVGKISGSAAAAPVASEQVVLTAIVDGAGDTKEEELGEWDGTRNTI